MHQSTAYYLKVAILSFAELHLHRTVIPAEVPLQLGMGVELFMIHTGFYEKVTEIEAERRVAAQDEMSDEKKAFYAELYRQMQEKNIKLPPNIVPPTAAAKQTTVDEGR